MKTKPPSLYKAPRHTSSYVIILAWDLLLFYIYRDCHFRMPNAFTFGGDVTKLGHSFYYVFETFVAHKMWESRLKTLSLWPRSKQWSPRSIRILLHWRQWYLPVLLLRIETKELVSYLENPHVLWSPHCVIVRGIHPERPLYRKTPWDCWCSFKTQTARNCGTNKSGQGWKGCELIRCMMLRRGLRLLMVPGGKTRGTFSGWVLL